MTSMYVRDARSVCVCWSTRDFPQHARDPYSSPPQRASGAPQACPRFIKCRQRSKQRRWSNNHAHPRLTTSENGRYNYNLQRTRLNFSSPAARLYRGGNGAHDAQRVPYARRSPIAWRNGVCNSCSDCSFRRGAASLGVALDAESCHEHEPMPAGDKGSEGDN